jgi:hypothetical protein
MVETLSWLRSLSKGFFTTTITDPREKEGDEVRRYNAMEKYENASIQKQTVSPFETLVSDDSTSTSEVMANGMVLSYFDELMSGNAE